MVRDNQPFQILYLKARFQILFSKWIEESNETLKLENMIPDLSPSCYTGSGKPYIIYTALFWHY